MHRLLVDSVLLEQESPRLSAEAARHVKVLRPKDGELFELFDGRGRWRVCSCRVGQGSPPVLTASSSVFSVSPSRIGLTLFACVTKGSRWDWTLEKATELGVSRVVPVISGRTIVRLAKDERAAKRERWQRIVEDAARQSDAKWLPEILPAVDFADVLALVRETTCFIGALTTPPSPLLADAIAAHPSPAAAGYSVFIGPEGDLTPDELSALTEIAVPTSFGQTVLRAETAAIFALSVLAALTRKENA